MQNNKKDQRPANIKVCQPEISILDYQANDDLSVRLRFMYGDNITMTAECTPELVKDFCTYDALLIGFSLDHEEYEISIEQALNYFDETNAHSLVNFIFNRLK